MDGREPVNIYTYTRKQAIEDGLFIDKSQIAERLGMTASLCITVDLNTKLLEYFESHKRPDEDLDNFWRSVIGDYGVASMLNFAKLPKFVRFTAHGIWKESMDMRIKAWLGPDDDGQLCITLMLPNER